MADLLSLDRRIFLYLNNLGTKQYDFFWLWLSGTWVWIPLYIIFLYLLYKNFGLKNLIFLLMFIGIGVTVSDQLAGIYKYGVMRLRPCHDPLLVPLMRSVKCGGSYGFYSSHASNTFFLATFLSRILARRYHYFTFFIFLWALLVSYSRIYLGVHFPLDVLMGASVGFFLGGFFSALAVRTISRKRI